MVSYWCDSSFYPTIQSPVLILVVVDDGLVRAYRICNAPMGLVLILIVVEDGLVRCRNSKRTRAFYVLILVVMEDGLVHSKRFSNIRLS